MPLTGFVRFCRTLLAECFLVLTLTASALAATATPSNDLFAARLDLADQPASMTVQLGSPGLERNEPRLKRGGGRTLWWSYTAPADGALLLDAASSSVDESVAIGAFSGESLRSLRKIVEGRTALRILVTAGRTYQICTDVLNRAAQTLYLDHRFVAAVENDRFSRRISLKGSSPTAAANSAAATLERGEARRSGRAGASVWYTWTAPANGWVYAVAQGDGWVPLIAISEGSSISRLKEIAASARSDNPARPAVVGFRAIAGRAYEISIDGGRAPGYSDWGPFELQLVFTTLHLTSPVEGMTYRGESLPPLVVSGLHPDIEGELRGVEIQLHRIGGEGPAIFSATNPPFAASPYSMLPGNYVAIAIGTNNEGREFVSPAVTFKILPAHDRFESAFQMPHYPSSWSGDLALAGFEKNEPRPYKDVAGSVWSRWTAPLSAPVDITLRSAAQARVAAFKGGSLKSLKQIQLRSTSPESFQFNAIAGETYHFAVYHRGSRASVLPAPFELSFGMPLVEIASPADQAVITDRQALPLGIRLLYLEPGSVDTVRYFINGIPVGTNTAPPFDNSISNLWPGTHTVHARVQLSDTGEIETPRVSVKVLLANDHFANAAPLEGEFITFAQLHGATAEPDESLVGFGYKSAWWTWMAPESGRFRIHAEGHTNMVWLHVFTGTSLEHLETVNSGPMQVTSFLEFVAVAGTTYHIALQAEKPSDGTLRMRMIRPPVNDHFASRTEIFGTNALLAAHLLEATQEPGEPVPPFGCGYTGRSVWWTWTALESGEVRIDARSVDCIRIGAFTGNSITNLAMVAFESDWLSFEAVAGVTYQLVMNNSRELENIEAQFTFIPKPINDAFVDRIRLEGTSIAVTSAILGAGFETGEPVHLDWWFGPRSAWYEWTAPASGTVRITSFSTFPTAVLDAYEGDTFETLRSLNIGWNPQQFTAVAGRTYYLALGSYGILHEPVSFQMDLLPSALHAGAGGAVNSSSRPGLNTLTPALPIELIRVGETRIELRWPARAKLESASSPDPAGSWTAVDGDAAVEIGGQRRLQMPATNTAQFFRLR
ncbi:MAG TPA: Ig-like domain-containing protein [Verrucomicrobiae bacterium]|nr:Ig-like domain-containing protein [Verrucomicrobiae bacterium]